MATKADLRKSFTITGRMWAEVGLEVRADNLEDALAQSKELKLADFITIEGDHNDSDMKITGVWEQYKEPVI